METISFEGVEFKRIRTCAYSNLYYNPELALAVCVSEAEYIPIESFKAIFLAVTDLMKNHRIAHFIFDKRNLRTFHQPSMEWYFAVWKPAVKLYGLTNHFKILPALDWFEKAVQAGKYEIFKKYNKNIIDGISIRYVASVEEVVRELGGTSGDKE